jgi:DNA-binding transcriptional LysR family regulator
VARSFVSFIDGLAAFSDLVALDQLLPAARIIFRSSSSMAQQAAVASGLGIGPLHVLSAERDANLVRLLPELEVKRSYWLIVHADLQRVPEIRAVIDFLEEIVTVHPHLL